LIIGVANATADAAPACKRVLRFMMSPVVV